MDALQDVIGALHSITEHYGRRIITGSYGTLEHCEMLRNVLEALWGVAEHYGTLWSMEHCVMLRNVMEAKWIVTECYGSVTELLRNVTKRSWKISILPINKMSACMLFVTLCRLISPSLKNQRNLPLPNWRY